MQMQNIPGAWEFENLAVVTRVRNQTPQGSRNEVAHSTSVRLFSCTIQWDFNNIYEQPRQKAEDA
jgi:hypothetical protein